MKRFVSLFLALLLLSSCTAKSPADGGKAQQDSDVSADVSAPESESEEDDGKLPCPVPNGVTFDGRDFRVLYRQSGYAYDVNDAFAEELTGEIINDAVYNRNLLMESKYGIKMVPLPEGSPTDTAVADFVSGSQGYDVMIDKMNGALPFGLKNYFYDFNKLTYVNPKDPWWDDNIARDLTVAGHLFTISGNVSVCPKDEAGFIFFSKGVADEYNIEYPYDMVREGTWTIDKMTQMVTQVSADLDGDGKITADDRVGLLKDTQWHFLGGCGVTYTQLDENGIPALAFLNEHTLAACEAVHALMDDKMCTLSYSTAASGRDTSGYPHIYDYVRGVFFATNHFLFVQCGAEEAPLFRDMDPGYGVLTNPKLNEEQQEYYHLVDDGAAAWFLPADPVDVDFTDQMFAAWCYHSDELWEAYYEKTLKHKRMDSPDDAEMLDIIFSSIRYEFATICDLGIVPVMGVTYGSGSYASAYAKYEKSIESKRQELFKDLIEDGN